MGHWARGKGHGSNEKLAAAIQGSQGYNSIGPICSKTYISLGNAPRADISVFLHGNQSSIYVRAGRGAGRDSYPVGTTPRGAGTIPRSGVGAFLGRGDYFFLQTFTKGHEETESRGDIIGMLTGQIQRYFAVLIPMFQVFV